MLFALILIFEDLNKTKNAADFLNKEQIYYGLLITTIGVLYLIWLIFRAWSDAYVLDAIAFRICIPILYILFGIGIISFDKLYQFYNPILLALTVSNIGIMCHLTAHYEFDPNYAYLLIGNIVLYHALYTKKIFLLLSYVACIGLFLYYYFLADGINLNTPIFSFVSTLILFTACLIHYVWLLIRDKRKENETAKYALFTSTPDPYLVYDYKKDEVVDANSRAVALFNLPNKRAFMLLQAFDVPLINFIRRQIVVITADLNEKGYWQIEHTTSISKQPITLKITVTKASTDKNNAQFYIRLIDVSHKEIAGRLTTMLLQGLNQMSDMMVLLDDRDQVFYANKESRQVLGYTDQELAAFPHISKVEPQFNRNKEKQGPQEKKYWEDGYIYETEYLTSKGTMIPVEVNYNSFVLEGQSYSCVIARNITTRLQMTQIVRQSEELFRTVFESGPLGIVICDLEGRISQANKAFCEILGYGSTELQGELLTNFSLEKDEGLIYNVLTSSGKHAIETTVLEQKDIEARYKRKDGKEIWLLLTGSIIVNALSEEQYTVIMADDITQRKNAEKERRIYQEKLENSVQQLTQFAYVVSHDLQEPLRMVSSYLQLLERRNKDNLDQNSKEFIHYAVDGSKRMHILIEALLKYSRVNTRGKELRPTNLNKIIPEVKRLLQHKIEETNAIIEVSELPTVHADSAQMVQVFQNLVDNAIKYRSDKPPHIQVFTDETPTHWKISVKDNGIGIEEEYHKQIFGVFKRLHTRDEYEGTGIGLAICKRIIERHEGTIHLDSKINEGTTFYFFLPK